MILHLFWICTFAQLHYKLLQSNEHAWGRSNVKQTIYQKSPLQVYMKLYCKQQFTWSRMWPFSISKINIFHSGKINNWKTCFEKFLFFFWNVLFSLAYSHTLFLHWHIVKHLQTMRFCQDHVQTWEITLYDHFYPFQ